MHVLLLGPRYWLDFTPFGHTETWVPLDAYETPLDRILADLPAPPDCIIQQEHLGTRQFVTGLEHAPCPTFFFAFDAHLNLFWQRHYGRLFDAVLTPHLSLFQALPPEAAVRNAFRLPPPGIDLAWTGHADRAHTLAFCGRLAPGRPIRSWMLALLRDGLNLEHFQDIPPEEVYRLYQDTRIIPNEAICFETNLRLFEAASAGAAVLTPDCGPDQAAVFTEGEEILVYRDGLDLCEKAAWLAAHPEAAETLGGKARERVQREHLPRHRATAVLDILSSLSQSRATGQEAEALAWLTRLERARAGDREYPARSLLARSETLPQTPEILAGMAHLLGTPSRKEAALSLCASLLESGSGTGSLACDATASALALAHGDTEIARRFLARHAPGGPVPRTAPDLCLAWAETHVRAGSVVRPGFAYAPGAGLLPACALEFLLFARHLCPERETGIKREEARILAPFPAYAPYRLSLLESLRGPASGPDEIRELAREYIFCCRVNEGMALLDTL